MTMLLPFISEQQNGLIWRLEVDAVTDDICLEVRNETDKKASFTSISLKTGDINFTDVNTLERWLTGMECAYNGILLLHNYQSENAPVHKGVIAINNKGETIWSNYIYAFDHLTKNGPILYNSQIQPRKLFLADINTGASLRHSEPVIDNELINNIILPDMVPASHLEERLAVEPYENIIHYLRHTKFRIVSLHTHSGGQLQQHLFIWNDREIVYEDLLHTDIQKMQPESFMVYKNSLIYIKNKSELKVINL